MHHAGVAREERITRPHIPSTGGSDERRVGRTDGRATSERCAGVDGDGLHRGLITPHGQLALEEPYPKVRWVRGWLWEKALSPRSSKVSPSVLR